MKAQRPMTVENEHVVLQFRPRGLTVLHQPRPAANTLSSRAGPDDLSRYEQTRDPPDDFRHRMLANAAAFAFTIALIAVGLWLAMSIADLRSTQDCALMGLRDCARISARQE
jgi:hypothetical protein